MTKRRTPPAASSRPPFVTALVLLAFLAPGAWLIVTLPPQPIAVALQVVSAALIALVGLYFVRGTRTPSWPVLAATGAMVVIALASLLSGVAPLTQLLHDLYGEMPGMIWLAYPLVFLTAAALPFGKSTRDALKALVFVAAALVAVMVVWRWVNGFVTSFGSPAYSIPALAPIPLVALGLAATSREHAQRYRALAAGIAAGMLYAGGGLSAALVVAGSLVVALAFAPSFLGIADKATRSARTVGIALLVVTAIAVALVEIPSLGGALLPLDDLKGAEQSVATRIHLWESGERMFVDRPLLGFGPAGYRFSAVGYYDPDVFSFIAGAGSDPTAYSAPSPHSILWETLTRMGALGMAAFAALAAVWVARIRALAGEDRLVVSRLRTAVALGFVAYLISLLVTPIHFASGLLGAFLAGLALAVDEGDRLKTDGRGIAQWFRIVLLAVAIALAAWGVWRGAGQMVGTIVGGDIAGDADRVAAARTIIPGEPLNERRHLDLMFYGADDLEDVRAARAAVDAAPIEILGYAPNLANFAAIGMNVGSALGEADWSWERAMLDRAEALVPGLPSLVAERLHLAVLEQDVAGLPQAIENARSSAATYPATPAYIEAAESLLAR